MQEVVREKKLKHNVRDDAARQHDVNDPPWCFFFAGELESGLSPRDILRLSMVCRNFRGGRDAMGVILQYANEALGLSILPYGRSFSDIFKCVMCRHAEHHFVHTIASVVARAAGHARSENCATIAGSFALYKHMCTSTGTNPLWEPGDIDIYIPYGNTHRGAQVFAEVVDYAKRAYESVTGLAGGAGEVVAYPDFSYGGEPTLVADEIVESLQYERTVETVAKLRGPQTYSLDAVRRAVSDMANRDKNMSEIQSLFAQLLAAGEMDTCSVPGINRPYVLSRVTTISYKSYRDSSRYGRYTRSQWLYADGSPIRRFNIIQYRGDPLTPEQVLEGFDINLCKVATSIAPGTARYTCTLSENTRRDIEEGRLRLTKYAFPPLFVRLHPMEGDELRDESWEEATIRATRAVVSKLLFRLQKYASRGFAVKRPSF